MPSQPSDQPRPRRAGGGPKKTRPDQYPGHPKTDVGGKEWKAVFIEALEKTKSVTSAADLAGRSRRHCYRERSEDPEFAEQWDEAWERVIDALEQSMMDKAINGYAEPVFQGGVEVGVKQIFMSQERIFLLKNNRKHKYEDRVQVTVTADEYAKSVREALESQDAEAKKALEPSANLTPEGG